MDRLQFGRVAIGDGFFQGLYVLLGEGFEQHELAF